MAGYDSSDRPGVRVACANGSSTTVATVDRDRVEIGVTNDSDTTIYLRLAATGAADLNSVGIRLNANGGNWVSNTWKGGVSAFQNGAAPKDVIVYEI